MLLAGLDDKQTVLQESIVGLIPLGLVVAHEALLVVPGSGIGATCAVELVAPDQFPLLCR